MKRFSFAGFISHPITLLVVGLVVLVLCIKGAPGNPTSDELATPKWKDEGIFELSPERGRFALTYSFIEDHSFQFTDSVAHFAAPDVAIAKGQFVSLFAPTVSFIVMPGYVLGRYLGYSQVGAFAIITLFALCNAFLIKLICDKLGIHKVAGTLASVIFLFATPAFAYATTLYQHHISTFLILLSIYLLLSSKKLWSLCIIWFLCALSISVDNPNLFLMFPIGLVALTQIISVVPTPKAFKVDIRVLGIATMIVMIIPIGMFLYLNKESYGNPFQLAGTAASADKIISGDAADISAGKQNQEQTDSNDGKSALGFFKTRNLPHGMYIHLFSEDRGILYFTPILFIGIIGLYYLSKDNPTAAGIFASIIAIDLVLYSMWGDPYGGWAFGSRYMIPAYALLSILVAEALSKVKWNPIIGILVYGVLGYSLFVNIVGALTTNRIPPKVEADNLSLLSGKAEYYNYRRGIQFLNENNSKALLFEYYADNYITAWKYLSIVAAIIGVYATALVVTLAFSKKNK